MKILKLLICCLLVCFTLGCKQMFSLKTKQQDWSYAQSPAKHTINIKTNDNAPTVKDLQGEKFSVTPILPEGMSINPDTGVISGEPTQVQAPKKYTITMTSASQATQTELSIEIAEQVPVLAPINPVTLTRTVKINSSFGLAILSVTYSL